MAHLHEHTHVQYIHCTCIHVQYTPHGILNHMCHILYMVHVYYIYMTGINIDVHVYMYSSM